MDEEDNESLYEWIDGIPLSRRTGNLARDFSDGVLMAEVLKYYYPRVVELHNYSPACSKALKIANWTTLNRKVLNKVGLQISGSTIANIVSGSNGAVQRLLERLHCKIEDGGKDNGSVAPVRNLLGEKIDDEKVVPISTLEKKEKEISELNEACSMLTQKVSHLESLIELKNQRIQELSAQLQKCKK